jgi:hypothetical protein
MPRVEFIASAAAFLLSELYGSYAFSHSQGLTQELGQRGLALSSLDTATTPASVYSVSPVGAFSGFGVAQPSQTAAAAAAGWGSGADKRAKVDWPATPGPFVGQPLRGGPWSVAEAAYAAKLVEEFDRGALDLPAGVGLRGFLATALHCR